MDIKEIRRVNLMRLIAEYESQQALADAVDVTPAVFSQIINKRRNIGEKMARKIEAKLGKPANWFDTPHKKNGKVRLEKTRSVRVPVIGWDQVEQIIGSDQPFEPSDYIVLPLTETQAYCLIIDGDSMTGPPGSDTYPP